VSSVNKAILIGRAVRDPEIRAMQNGKEVASFSLATNSVWLDKSSGEKKEKSEFHNIVIFNEGLVSVVKNYVKKGSQLYIEGAIQTRKWQDSNGADRYTTEIVLQAYGGTLQLLGGRPEQGEHQEAKQNGYAPQGDPFDDSGIPF